ncbi:AAA family ATPase [Marinitenerispora sediminis]|uniref:AAA family ATPase n=1 Tax=Marinitenerispora sediminis TaxID=1931232 RepID=UPI000DF297C5|nr:AAA family ATPase [Marinitenerispora sediminis]RCV60176.1 ATPase [Marinitenerispora sediminis]
MPRDDRPRTTGRPAAPPPLQRLRSLYDRYPPRSRLLAGLVAVTVAALAAFLADVSVLLVVTATVLVLALFAALMRSGEAVATALVCAVWLAVAYPLFQIPLAGAPIVLVLLLLPPLVTVAATRIREFPVWHTTLLALLVGLIVGLAVALTSMLTDAVPPAVGITCTVAAAGAALLWRAAAAYRLRRELRGIAAEAAGPPAADPPPPGTGKTSVARTLATIFHSFGLLPSPHVVEAQRADLVGEYLGATAIRTNELVDRALGGVLFIDEAYSLVNDGDGQPDRFGNEAVQTLLKRAEDDRDRLVVILAGYEAEMDRFLASNPGLASRFATRVTFPSYRPEELHSIAEHLFQQRGDVLDEEAGPVLRARFDEAARRGAVDELGNGRFVRSLVEKAAEARDVRVVTSGEAGRQPAAEDLVTVRAGDIAAAYQQLTERLPGFSRTPDLAEALAELDDMIGLEPVKHLGATAVKTNKLVDRALGGVLFVDEAYSLANPGYSGGDAFGAEAIQTLLKRAEDDRSRLVIVLAGYPGEMDRFLASNAGLASRFNVRVAFPSYSPDELTEIAEAVAGQTGDVFEEQAREDLHQIFGYVCAAGWIDELGNGRFARSLFEKACSYRDLRVAEELGDAATADDLTRVTSADLRQAYAEITQT